MTKHPPKLEWHVCEDEAEWRKAQSTLQETPAPPPVRRTRRILRRRRGWIILALLVLLPLLVEGYREVRRADEAMTRVEQEVAAAVAEAWVGQPKLKSAGTPIGARVGVTASVAPPRGLDRELEVRKIEVRGDYAMVEVWTHASSLPWLPVPYRQTRFFHETAQGWRPTTPPDRFYQPLETLQVGRFTFIYGPRDASTVLAAAATVEAVDTDLRAELGLPPTDAPLTVMLATDFFISSDPADLARMADGGVLFAPSPALLPLPAEITEGDALLQLVAGLLIQANLDAALGDAAHACAWQYVMEGLRLWLLDEYSELPSQSLYNAQASFQRRQTRGILPRLVWFGPKRPECSPNYHAKIPASVGVYAGRATAFVDYAVTTYGRARLPALIDGMQRHNSWEELISAVFGVSAAEFETGWQEYLSEDK